eukprot:Rhum_TRINITY_DN14297_c17_g1::Rhum_TRINITY_DN14297_c17_g1_i2::g.78754::m.78754
MEASPTSQGPGTPTEGTALPTPPLEAMDGDELPPITGADAPAPAPAAAATASPPACPAATDAASSASSSASACSPAGKQQDPPQEKCSCCNKLTPNLRKCPCLLVSYCDPKCQVDHWPVHRSLCAAVRRSQTDKSAEGKAAAAAAVSGEAAAASQQAQQPPPPAAPKVDEKQQLQAQLQRALQQQQAMRAQNSYTTQQMYSGRPHMRQPLGGTDLRVLMEGIERVAATSPRSVAQIVVELIKTNPQVLAPAAFSMTKQVLAKAEAELYTQQQQQQQQQAMLSMMSRRDTATAAAAAAAVAAPSDLPPPPPLYSSDALKQQQALKAADAAAAAAQQSARMKKQQQQWSATEAAAGPSAWDAWMKSGGSASPMSSASSAGRTPDRHSENTRLSTPLKSSLDFDPNESLASSIASAILED